MKIASICNTQEMYIGLKLAGIDGYMAKDPNEFTDTFNKVTSDNQVGIVVIAKEFSKLTEPGTMPLIIEV